MFKCQRSRRFAAPDRRTAGIGRRTTPTASSELCSWLARSPWASQFHRRCVAMCEHPVRQERGDVDRLLGGYLEGWWVVLCTKSPRPIASLSMSRIQHIPETIRQHTGMYYLCQQASFRHRRFARVGHFASQRWLTPRARSATGKPCPRAVERSDVELPTM